VYQTASPPRTASPRPTPAPPKPRRPPSFAGESLFLVAADGAGLVAAGLLLGTPPVVTASRTAAVVLALAAAGLYRSRLRFSILDDLARMVLSVAAVVAATAGLDPLGRFGVPAAALLGGLLSARAAGHRLLCRHRRRAPGRVTLLLGCDGLAQRLAGALSADRSYGMAPVGFIGTAPPVPPRLPVLAPADGLERAIRRYKPVHLIVACPAGGDDEELVAALRRCRRTGVVVHVVPRLFEVAAGSGGAELVNGIPLVRLRPEPAQTRRWAVKRAVDVCGAAAGLVLLAPVLLACALAAWWEFRRNGVIFRQERISRDGKPFTILKFRSLTPATSRESQVKWNINSDARLGPVGRLLRFSSLDELPQLLNVLRGDMSLVGPRPERPYFVEQFQAAYAGYADRHRVPAGITGWAQIHGLRGDTSIEDRVRFDNHYIEHWSLTLDLKILLRTVGAMAGADRLVTATGAVRAVARLLLAPLAWLLAAAGAAVRRPSLLVAGTLLLTCLPSGISDVAGSGHVTPADIGAGVVVAAVAVRMLRGDRSSARRAWLPFAALIAALALATLTASGAAASAVGFVRYAELFVLVPVAVAMSLRDRLDVFLVAGAFVAVTLAEGAAGVYQAATGTGAAYGGQFVRAVGTFGPDQVMALGTLIGYGLLVTLALGFASHGRPRIALLAGAAFLVVPLGLTLSRGVWIATAAAVTVLLVLASWRAALWLGLAATLVVAVFALGSPGDQGTVGRRAASIVSSGSVPDQSVRDRYALWHTAVAIWKDHPVAGVGLKDFAEYRDSYAPVGLSAGSDVGTRSSGISREPLLSAHNQYLMVLSEQGTVGVLAFGALLLTLTVGALRRRDTGLPPPQGRFLDLAAPAVMVWTLVDFMYGDIGAGPTSVLLAVILGIAARRGAIVPKAVAS
jgi:exopolysaccharide biosynthesis polyprenyl glycosylphosphotransferase